MHLKSLRTVGLRLETSLKMLNLLLLTRFLVGGLRDALRTSLHALVLTIRRAECLVLEGLEHAELLYLRRRLFNFQLKVYRVAWCCDLLNRLLLVLTWNRKLTRFIDQDPVSSELRL